MRWLGKRTWPGWQLRRGGRGGELVGHGFGCCGRWHGPVPVVAPGGAMLVNGLR
jgi:hypothetical protein